MIDLENIRAIDIHTHAEEPCGNHGDDGCNQRVWPIVAQRPLSP